MCILSLYIERGTYIYIYIFMCSELLCENMFTYIYIYIYVYLYISILVRVFELVGISGFAFMAVAAVYMQICIFT